MVVEDQIRKRLMRLADICLSFPGSTREDESRHSTFRVGKKIFAYYLNDHDRDQIISVCCRVLEGDNLRLVQSNPRKFYLRLASGQEGGLASGLTCRPLTGQRSTISSPAALPRPPRRNSSNCFETQDQPQERFPDRERYTALRNCRESVPAKIAA